MTAARDSKPLQLRLTLPQSRRFFLDAAIFLSAESLGDGIDSIQSRNLCMQQTPPVTRGFVVCGDQPVEAIMSCGGCNARADAIRAGALAIASGDRAELDRQMKAFTASAKDDAVKIKQSASQGITRALARLGSRRG